MAPASHSLLSKSMLQQVHHKYYRISRKEYKLSVWQAQGFLWNQEIFVGRSFLNRMSRFEGLPVASSSASTSASSFTPQSHSDPSAASGGLPVTDWKLDVVDIYPDTSDNEEEVDSDLEPDSVETSTITHNGNSDVEEMEQ